MGDICEAARRATHVVRPHFVFRPRQLATRLGRWWTPECREQRFRLPWGVDISAWTFSPDDPLGRHLRQRGIFDPLVCETLLRLTDPGETVLDVGANIGHMTSLLAYAVGGRGRVIAFEPHPDTFALLRRNTTEWSALAGWPTIEIRQVGLSDRNGIATLATDVYDINQGAPSLEPRGERGETMDEHSVQVQRLDDILNDAAGVGVMKLDIEGHELQALHGASALLSTGRIRDIVFEEHEEPPTPVTELFDQNGYTVMRIGERLRGPMLGPLFGSELTSRDPPSSLLATRAPERVVDLMRVRGWAVFGVGPAGRAERSRRG
jgi:FkbM family methyltransferase